MLNWLRSLIGAPDADRTRRIRDPRVDDLIEGMRTLSGDAKALRLEWEESYESLNRALRKLAKREARAKPCGGEDESAEPRVTQPGVLTDIEALRAARQRYPGAF